MVDRGGDVDAVLRLGSVLEAWRPKAGPGGDQCTVSNLAGVAFGQCINLVGREFGHAVPICLEVINQEYVRDAEAG